MNSLQELLTKYEIPEPRSMSECPKGWLPLVDNLFQQLISLGWDKNLHQLKEKRGTLRVYVGGASDEIYHAIDKAEMESFKICQECGEPVLMTILRNKYRRLCKNCVELEE